MKIKRIGWKKIILNKYSHLLSLLIILFILSPYLEGTVKKLTIFTFIFLLAILLTLRTLPLSRKTISIAASLAAVSFLLDFIINIGTVTLFEQDLLLINIIIYSVFLSYATILLARRIFSIKKVTADTIQGGICIYLLLGILWTLFYIIIYSFDNSAFFCESGDIRNKFFYFSFTTLTTVGYGDIFPKNKIAMVFCSLESIAGQIYLAVFIARLVGLYIIEELKKEIT